MAWQEETLEICVRHWCMTRFIYYIKMTEFAQTQLYTYLLKILVKYDKIRLIWNTIPN